MRIEAHKGLTEPIVFEADRILICNPYGDPIVFAVEIIKDHHWRVFRAGDKDFNEQLQLHGINRTVLVTKLDPNNLKVK